MTQATQAQPPVSTSPYVKEVTAQNFMAEVIQPSLQLPVLVYFTAAWCQPCKQYGPLLEKVVNAAKGKVRLARVDIDKSPQLAQQFRIQSVPMVYIFLQGQPLDGFAGALPESQLKQLIDQVAGAGPEAEAAQATLEQAAALYTQGEIAQAKDAYVMLLSGDDQNPKATAGLAQCLIAERDFAAAEQLLADLTPEKQKDESVVAALAMLKLAKNAPDPDATAQLQKRLAANPADHEARLEWARALFAEGREQEAVDELLAIVAKDKHWNDGAARTQLLAFFEALGFASPVAAQGRRKLSSLLFA